MSSPMEGQPETVRYRPQRDHDTKVGEETKSLRVAEMERAKQCRNPWRRGEFFFLKEAMAGK